MPDERDAPDRRGAYVAALVAVLLATLARWALGPVIGEYVPFATFFVAIVVAAWRGGLYPALLATVLGFVLTVVLFPSAQYAGTGLSGRRVVAWLLYFAVSGSIAAFGEAVRRGRRRLQRRDESAREQAQLLKITLASIGDAVITTDAAGVVTYMNPVAEQLTGQRAEAVRGRPLGEVFAIVHEITRVPVENPVAKVLARGQVVGLSNHTVLRAGDGVERLIDHNGAPIRGDDGRIIGVVLVFRDVTERRRSESVLHRQTAILRAISDGTTDMVTLKDTASRLLFANPAALEQMGLPEEDVIGADPATLVRDPEELAAILAIDRRILASNTSEVVEQVYTGVRGRRHYQSTKSPMRDESGQVVGLIAISRDVTERRAVEERLLQSEAEFRRLADSMPQIVYAVEPDGRVTFVNEQWRTYTGQDAAQTPDLTPLVHPDDLPGMVAAWREATATVEPYTAEFRLRRAADGAYRWFLTRSTPVVDEAGQLVRWYGTSTDIHAHKLAEARIRASEARQALVVRLSDRLRPLRDPTEVQAAASDLLGHTLDVSRVVYFEVVEGHYRIVRDFARGVPSLAGEYPTSSFGPRLFELFQRGEMACETDVLAAPLMSERERQAFTDLDARAFVAVPLVKDGVFVAGLSVLDDEPRAWTPDELALVQEAAERTWAAVERARVEAALVTSEARFRTLFETIDEGFCVVEVMFDRAGAPRDYRILEVNPAFERHTGLQGVLGRSAREFAPDLEEFWFETYGRVALTGESVRFEHQAKPLGGRWFDVYAFRLGADDSRKVAILFTDVTARTLAAQAASQRSEQVQRLAAVLPRISATSDIQSILGVVTVEARRLIDTHRSIATFSTGDDASQAVVVSSISDATGAPDEPVPSPADEVLRALVCRANTPLRLTRDELAAHPSASAADPAGRRPVPLNGWLGAPLVSRDGRNMGLLQLSDKTEGEFTADDEAVLQQVAQMTAVAIDNARLVDDLQMADRRKDEFLSVLAHELRNPLAPIRSGLHLLKMAHTDPQTASRAREIMDRQVTQMVRLIDDLMDLTRISRGKLAVQKARVPLDDVLRIAVETSRPLIEQAAHTLTIDLPDTPIVVDADETRLAQVFANLLNNAAKYTPPGGHVRLAVVPAGAEVVVEVADNGAGIPESMLGQVFDMFTQVDRSLERAQGGLGIGLNIARRLVEKHGGTITAESDGDGQGSRFVVRLPVAAAQAAAEAPSVDGPAAPSGPRRRVLVVDDNLDAASSLSLMLEAMGHDTRTARDGREAVTLAGQYRPDLVLMDIGMPTLNGYDACRQIRQQPWGRDLMIVACTGWGQEEDRQRSRDAGFDQHIVKPPSPTALEQLVAGLDRPGD